MRFMRTDDGMGPANPRTALLAVVVSEFDVSRRVLIQ
jgi:hypothetical protein